MEIIKEVLYNKYAKSAKVIESLWKEATNKRLDDKMTKYDMMKFVQLLQGKYAPATARQYAARLKAVLNTVSDTVELPNGYGKMLSPKAPENVDTYMTDEEIVRFSNYVPMNNRERMVQAIFLLECYTGARTSDCENMDASTINNGMIDYVSIKTKIHTIVPCKPIVERILKFNDNRCATVSESVKCKIIRKICKEQSIDSIVKVYKAGKEITGKKYDFITSHSGRRSFATNLYLKGCDLYTLSKLMGHANATMTENYLCCEGRKLPGEVLEYFK